MKKKLWSPIDKNLRIHDFTFSFKRHLKGTKIMQTMLFSKENGCNNQLSYSHKVTKYQVDKIMQVNDIVLHAVLKSVPSTSMFSTLCAQEWKRVQVVPNNFRKWHQYQEWPTCKVKRTEEWPTQVSTSFQQLNKCKW